MSEFLQFVKTVCSFHIFLCEGCGDASNDLQLGEHDWLCPHCRGECVKPLEAADGGEGTK